MSQSSQQFAEEMRSKGYVETSPGVWSQRPFLESAEKSDHKPATSELKLHDEIETELNKRRWYYAHSRTDRPTTTALGVTDFIIAAPNGITYWVEAKAKGRKLTAEQTITKHVLLGLNHRHAVVFSFGEFMETVK